MPSGLTVEGMLTVHGKRGLSANERWLELLSQFEHKRSIVHAARAVGLSYKAAWDAIETMNNLADAPLVVRAAGGRGGGGTTLTSAGLRLVRTFRIVQRQKAAFLTELNRNLGEASMPLRVLGRLGVKTSARNQFGGTVASIRRGSVNDEITVEMRGGQQIVAMITRDSTRALGLKKGSSVVAWVKSSWVILALGVDASLRLSARNQLQGRISRISVGSVNSDVVLELPGGNTVAATVTNRSARALRLKRGLTVTAVFKASSVILAVAG
jgi:molybdate transport system regulatory protein